MIAAIWSRLPYVFLMILTVALGLASRKFSSQLPLFIAAFAGDTLWAANVVFLARFIYPNLPIKKTAVYAAVFSLVIELSQLYQGEWILALRRTLPGALILGHGFLWSDLVCYAVGVLLGAGVLHFRCRNNPPYMSTRGDI